jgi:hypothetical protein
MPESPQQRRILILQMALIATIIFVMGFVAVAR